MSSSVRTKSTFLYPLANFNLRPNKRLFSACPKVVSLFESPLHNLHVSRGGKMVPYAGWSLPTVYDDLNIFQSVLHTRKHLSLFDVSHMMQVEVSGNDAEQFLETILVSDLQKLKKEHGSLSLLTNDHGGIIDDCVVTRLSSNCFYIVANAACAEKDRKHLMKRLDIFKDGSSDVVISVLNDKALIALQGPMLALIMKEATKGNMNQLYFMNSAEMSIFGIKGCRVTRCGYTGEDGIEVSVPSTRVIEMCEKFLKNGAVKLAGLGSRDILRTEAGLCLYGNEISEDISPVEAGLAWCIGKRRRKESGFPGSKFIIDQLVNGVKRTRIGLMSKGPVLRQHCKITDNEGLPIGDITSGCPSPTTGSNIAMAYVPKNISSLGSTVNVSIRNQTVQAIVSKLPFVQYSYYKRST